MQARFDTRPGPTSRRSFLRAAAVATCGVTFSSLAGAKFLQTPWVCIREVIESGAIGTVKYASALVPFSATTNSSTEIARFGAMMPRAVSDALDGILLAMSQAGPQRLELVRHTETGAFSMNGALANGATFAVATTHANRARAITIRGTSGALYLNGECVLDSEGHCREIRL